METAVRMSRRSVNPDKGFKHMGTTVRADGRPDGFHTGGVWLTPDETKVYKPLTAWPCANATERYPTDEAECLAVMSGKPGFLPRDAWHIELLRDQWWLVMPRLLFWPQNIDVMLHPTMEHLLLIESAVRAMNAAGWLYNDSPQLAYYQGTPVLMDFSNAHRPTTWDQGYNDEFRMARWWQDMGHEDISLLRRRGKHIRHAVRLPEFCDPKEEPFIPHDLANVPSREDRSTYEHIYASQYRPMTAAWGPREGIVYLNADEQKEPRVYTWLACDHELPADLVNSLGLTMAWVPWA